MAGQTTVTVVTAAGRGLLVTSAVLLVVAYGFGYTAPAVVGLAGLGSLAAAGLATAGRFDDGAQVPRVSKVDVARGETVAVDVQLDRRGIRRLRTLRTTLSVGPDLAVRGAAERGDDGVRFRVLARRRGVGVIGPVTVARTDPFGLVTRRRVMSGTVSVVVRPVARILPVPPIRGGGGGAAARGASVHDGVAFDSLREYTEDDDIRHVHWLASLRTGDDRLLVRVALDPADPRDLLVLDTAADAYGSGPAAEDWFEVAVDVAASTGVSFAAIRRPFTFATSGGRVFASRSGPGDALRFLDLLARIQPDAGGRAASGPGRLAEVLAAARTKGAARLIIVTGADADAGTDADTGTNAGTGARDAIGAATAWCPRVVVLRVGASEASPAPAPTRRLRPGRLTEIAVRSLDDLAAAWPAAANVGRGTGTAAPAGRP